MAGPQPKNQKINIAIHGGLKHVEQLLELCHDKDSQLLSDVVFVSINVKVSKKEREKAVDVSKPPLVKEVGIAILDPRLLQLPSTHPIITAKRISTLQFSTSHASEDSKGSGGIEFAECILAKTQLVTQTNLAATITKSLCIEDNEYSSTDPDSRRLRNIVIVGHSPTYELKVLLQIGVDFCKNAPVTAVLDTHLMTRSLLGPKACPLKGAAPMMPFTLAAILTELGCPYKDAEFQNAGNSATYTLHAMLMLAIRSSEGKELTPAETDNLKRVRAFTQSELDGTQRRRSVRGALGIYGPPSK